jgi:hypothetical protein
MATRRHGKSNTRRPERDRGELSGIACPWQRRMAPVVPAEPTSASGNALAESGRNPAYSIIDVDTP